MRTCDGGRRTRLRRHRRVSVTVLSNKHIFGPQMSRPSLCLGCCSIRARGMEAESGCCGTQPTLLSQFRQHIREGGNPAFPRPRGLLGAATSPVRSRGRVGWDVFS